MRGKLNTDRNVDTDIDINTGQDGEKEKETERLQINKWSQTSTQHHHRGVMQLLQTAAVFLALGD